jgi:hypothetical protein
MERICGRPSPPLRVELETLQDDLVLLRSISIPIDSADRKSYGWKISPLMCKGGAAHWCDDVDTAQIAVSFCCSPGQLAGSASSCPVGAAMHTPTCRLLPPSFACGDLHEAIHPVLNRLMYSGALPTLLGSDGTS